MIITTHHDSPLDDGCYLLFDYFVDDEDSEEGVHGEYAVTFPSMNSASALHILEPDCACYCKEQSMAKHVFVEVVWMA